MTHMLFWTGIYLSIRCESKPKWIYISVTTESHYVPRETDQPKGYEFGMPTDQLDLDASHTVREPRLEGQTKQFLKLATAVAAVAMAAKHTRQYDIPAVRANTGAKPETSKQHGSCVDIL